MIGSFTYLDAALAALAFISALLAMYRGLTRELLSIVSWAVAAAVAFYFWQYRTELAADVAQQMGVQLPIAQVAISALAFLIVLIVVHIITAKISDAILDSSVGMIDSILGFLFGAARAYLIVVIVFMGYTAFIPNEQDQFAWVRDAKCKHYLQSTGEALRSTLINYIPESFTQPPSEDEGVTYSPKQKIEGVA